MTLCRFTGCGRNARSKGYCGPHYEQMRTGRPLTGFNGRRSKHAPPRITCDEVPCPSLGTPCHVFRGAKTAAGYGCFSIEGETVAVHRHVWERVHGPIPDGMVLDHQCRVRPCCNEDHIRLVTPKINATENIVGVCWQLNAAKTHCSKGHPYNEANTYRSKTQRQCRQCQRERLRRRRLCR